MHKNPAICLFGGTFDPIHEGHIHIAKAAVSSYNIDKVIFLPCAQSPHKLNQESAAEEHRMNMCELATADLPWAEVNDFDITTPSPSYSWKTAEYFRHQFPSATLYWLLGADQWDVLHLWRRIDYLAEMIHFIVCTRGTQTLKNQPYTSLNIQTDHPASSTAIRNAIAKHGNPQWLDKRVLNFIYKMRLYC